MMPKRKPIVVSSETLVEIKTQLGAVEAACSKALIRSVLGEKERREAQQASIKKIEEAKGQFKKTLDKLKAEGKITARVYLANLQQLLLITTYDFHKVASRQDFGIVDQPKTLPRDCVTEDQLNLEVKKDVSSASKIQKAWLKNKRAKGTGPEDIVASANVTQKARLKEIGKLVFCKRTKPKIAMLEIVAAEFFRQILGSGGTSHGKVIVEGKDIRGMYVEAIPGFISMRQLTDLAKKPGAVNAEITKLQSEVDRLKRDFEAKKKSEETEELAKLEAKLQENESLLGSYTQIRDLKLLNTETGSVNIKKISSIIAKALCSGFYFQDWDRHKDNWGVSFKDGKLSVASLDYDKSLSGIFDTGKTFDWSITPQRLKNFPDFDCWYWPTSSATVRENLAKKFTPEKVPKMYSEEEAGQYSALKEDEHFQLRTQVEWLKLIFIPKELRQRAVDTLASSDCDQRLKDAPEILESRRKELLNAAVQLKGFRELILNEKNVSTLRLVRVELLQNLSVEEARIVEKNWNGIEKDLKKKVNWIESLEIQLKASGPQQLLKAIEGTGISFSPTVTEKKLRATLAKLDVSQTSNEICKILNQELGLDITEDDARKIKEEKCIRMIVESTPGELAKLLTEKFNEGQIRILGQSFGVPAAKGIQNFKSAFAAYKDAVTNNDSKVGQKLEKAIKCLRDLGISASVIPDDKLRKSLEAPIKEEQEQRASVPVSP